jgi:hypothetical protein
MYTSKSLIITDDVMKELPQGTGSFNCHCTHELALDRYSIPANTHMFRIRTVHLSAQYESPLEKVVWELFTSKLPVVYHNKDLICVARTKDITSLHLRDRWFIEWAHANHIDAIRVFLYKELALLDSIPAIWLVFHLPTNASGWHSIAVTRNAIKELETWK